MSQEPCECLERWDALGIVFVYLAVLRNDPKWVRPTATCKSRWVKRGKNLLFPLSARVAHTLPFREMLRCQRSAPGQHHSVRLLSQPWLRDAQGTSPGIRRSHTSYQREFSPGANSLLAVFHLLPFLFSFCCLFFSFLLSLAITALLKNSKKYLSAHGLQEKAC